MKHRLMKRILTMILSIIILSTAIPVQSSGIAEPLWKLEIVEKGTQVPP